MLTRDDIFAVLDTVKDPEVPVLSVIELGVVRDVELDDAQGVTVVVTPTYSGCPAMQVIEADIVAALRAHGVGRARVRTSYMPAWTTDWLSDEAKQKLEAYGSPRPAGRQAPTTISFPSCAERTSCAVLIAGRSIRSFGASLDRPPASRSVSVTPATSHSSSSRRFETRSVRCVTHLTYSLQ